MYNLYATRHLPSTPAHDRWERPNAWLACTARHVTAHLRVDLTYKSYVPRVTHPLGLTGGKMGIRRTALLLIVVCMYLYVLYSTVQL